MFYFLPRPALAYAELRFPNPRDSHDGRRGSVAAIFPRRVTAAWRRAGRRLVVLTAGTDGQSIPRPPPARLQAGQGEPPGCDRDVHARERPPARLTAAAVRSASHTIVRAT